MLAELWLLAWLGFLWFAWYDGLVTDERDVPGELRVRLVREDEVAWYNALMAEHHSLGVAASGRVLRYVAEAGGVPLVLGTFGSAAWRVPVRDDLIGWDGQQRAARLSGCARISGCACCPPPPGCRTPRRGPWRHAADSCRPSAGIRGAAGCRRVVHRPGHARGDGVQGVRVHRGRGDGRVRQVPRPGSLRASRPAEDVLAAELAPGGLAALKAGFDSRADRAARPGLQRP